ncbi:hypothetical protein ACIQBJ_25325 [Kitasatospora sp. NPDC088391]|uniref:hypothetical protein n=1 Tax=Kitasatospora sp. NPDC088391 TaxID=3364074 RepID=UPI003822B816
MSNDQGESQVRKLLSAVHEDLLTVPADVDLAESRLVNSLKFMSIIQDLIDISGRAPDLDAIPMTKLRTIAGLTEVFFGPEPAAAQ